ncbi:uncharacterized protein [Phaseolus vulgaris]|uniref:uncharacterized protein n=1 Tax=Phaseolus vulgaris TaxID=3885 RepID=UPI0035CC6EDE
MVASWLVHSVSVHIRQSIIWMDKALDVWNDLKARFSQGDLSRISDLQMEASSLNQGDLSVTDYFTKLRIIWDELDNFRPDPICSCNEPSVIIQRKREDQEMQFLRDLNDQYNNIKAHILLMEPVPAITKFFSLVIQQERQFNNSVLVANVKNVTPVTSVNHTSTNTITCSFCGKLGHSESVCFKKNGFPNQDNRGSKFGSNKNICTYGNKIGHTVDVCYKKHGYPSGYRSQYGKSSQSNNVSTTIQEENFGNQDQNKQNNGGDFRITQHQYQILSELLKNVNSSNNQVQVNQVGSLSADHQGQNSVVTGNIQKLKNSNFNEYTWILDSGATDHNSRTKDKIGTVDLVAGLYVFNKTGGRIMSCTTEPSNIWHLRMGHPSDERYTWVFPMHNKSEVRASVVNFIAYA